MRAMATPLSSTLSGIKQILWAEAPRYVKRCMVSALALVILASAITALAPLVMKVLIDEIAEPRASDISLWVLVPLLALSHWLARALAEARTYVNMQGNQRMYHTVCNRLFEHVMRLPLRYHLKRQTGVLAETLSNGLRGYEMVSNSLVMLILPMSIEFLVVIVVFVGLRHADILGIFLLATVCYAAAFRVGARLVMERARTASMAQVNTWGVLTDSLLNYETIKLFSAESIASSKFDAAAAHTEFTRHRYNATRLRVGVLVATIFAAFVFATYYLAATLVMSGAFTIGTFVLISTYLFRLVQPLEQIGNAIQQMSQGCAYLEQMLAVFGEAPEPIVSSVGLRLSGPGELEFRDVSFAYTAGRPILRNVCFRARAGQTIGIVGASGSGKSSLLRLATRLLDPDSGEILLDGVPISIIPQQRLRELVAVVPQDPVLFCDSIGNNIAFGKAGSSMEDVERATRLAQLHDFVMSLPEKYETEVGERGVQLSGGERQRVAIARAAIRQPLIYIFDEATSSLDSHTERDVLMSLREIAANTTTLVIAHRLSTIAHADQIVVLERGSIIEAGTHAQLLGLHGRYARMWDAQQSFRGERLREDVLQ